MERRTFYSLFIGLLCFVGFSAGSQAQSVTGITFTSNTTCAGGSLMVSYTVSSTFSSGNDFVAYLSDNTGFFSTAPTEIGRITSTTAGSINVTIPASTGSSSSYRIGIAATKPATRIVSSAGTLTVSSPGLPGTSPVGYCQGQTASSLQATPASGATLNWYGTNSSGGTASPVPPVPSTGTAGSTTYYVSQTLNGCEGARAGIVVTVTAKPAAPTSSAATSYCQNQSAAALTANGTNLKWYGSATSTAGSSVAPTPNTSAVGPTDYFVSQTVNGCESDRTTITITTKAGPAAPAVAAPPTYCQNQTASALSATPSTGGTLNWYGTNSSGGTASGNATVPGTSQAGTTPYYVSQTVNGCESTRASISVTVNATPAAPAVTNVSLCNNGPSQQLTASATAGNTLKWYNATDVALSEAPTPGTGSVGNLTYKVSQVSSAGCESSKSIITVTVNAIPSAPSVSAPGPYCSGNTASALIATGQNLKWYGANQTGGTASTNVTIPSTAASAIGTTTYYVTQTVNGCESARAGIPVEVRSTPSGPAVAAVAFCQGTPAPVLSATAVSGAALNWYGTNASGGSALPTAPTPPNATATTLNYYVSQTLNGCEGSRAIIPITVNGTPAAPGVANVSLCNNGPSQPLTASGSNLKWFDANDNALNGAPTPGTGSVGNLTYKVTQTSSAGCESSKSTITVTVNAIPAQPTVSTAGPYCSGTSASALAANGQSLKWYGASATGGTASGNATVPGTDNSVIGTTTYYVTQTVNGCESARAGIPVIVKTTPGGPTVQNLDFCQGYAPPALTAGLVSNATVNWYGTNQAGGTASSTAPTPGNNTVGTTTFYVSQTLDGCEGGRSSLLVRVKATPGAPGVNNIALCNNGPSQQLTASGSNLKWYDANDAGLGNTAPTPSTGSPTTLTYKVSQTSGEGCESGKSSILVVINPLPAAPGVATVVYCQSQQDQPAQSVGPVTANGANLRWYNTDGNAFGSAPTPSIAATGTTTFQVTQTVNNCEGPKASLQVIVNSTTAPAVSQTLVTYCINDKAPPLTATAEAGGSLRWIDPYGNVTQQAPTPLTLNVNVKPGGDEFYVYQVGANGCYSPRATIKSVVNATPTLSLTAVTPTVNLGQRAAVRLKFTSVPPFSYTLTGGYSGVVLTTDTTISVLPRATTTYQIIALSNGCGAGLPGNPATAQVSVSVPTVTASSLSSASLCAGSSLSVPFTTTGQFNTGNVFRAELVSVADTSKKYTLTTTTTASPISGTLPASLPGGLYYVRVNADNPEIGIIGGSSPTQLNIRPLASGTLTGTQNIYEGSPASLTLALVGDAPWQITYADSLRSYSATATATPYLLEVRPTRTTTYRLLTVTNNCGSGPVSGTATVSVLPLLGVQENTLDPLVKTYPIPTQTVLMVELDLPLAREPAKLSLTDFSGRTVLEQTTQAQKNQLDLTSQNSGIYLLRIQVGDRQTVRKILKQ